MKITISVERDGCIAQEQWSDVVPRIDEHTRKMTVASMLERAWRRCLEEWERRVAEWEKRAGVRK